MLKQFYEKLLPSHGVYCAVGIKGGVVKQRFAESIDELLEIANDLKNREHNVYIAPNSFDGHTRKAAKALLSRSFFVDLDVGSEEKKYPNKQEAYDALNTFVFGNDLPPPVIIDSGTGIQAYWLFEDDVPASDWIAYATKFKEYCIDNGLRIDPAVTADVARIMRCPDTFNYKTEPPNPTKFLSEEINQYDFGMFKEFLGEVEVNSEVADIFAKAKKGLDNEVDVFKNENFEYDFSDIAEKSLNGKGCNQIKYILEKAAECPEPLWYAGISVAVRCVDGKEAIHMMSEDYPGYSPSETEYKAQQSLENASWAHSCLAFEKENPSGCDGCPFKGKLRSKSPIDLGRKFIEATEEPKEVGEADAVRDEANPKEVPFFPPEIRPFVRGKFGGVYFMPPADENGDRDDPVSIIDEDFYPVKRVWAGPTDKECLLMRYVLPHDPLREFLLPLKYVCTFDKLKQILFENGVNFHISQTQKMFDYLNKWTNYLKKKEESEIMRQQLGWTEDRSAFVLGTVEITSEGKERQAAISPMIRNVSKFMRPMGSYQVWKDSVNRLNEPGFEILALGLLQGFASPLMTYTAVPGATICYQNTDSGVGKTGAVYAGLSVFGDPYNSSILEGLSTDNAFTGRYLGLKNILLGLDEVSNIPADLLSKLLHRISQGKAKLRMQSSANAERDHEMSASLQGAWSSNQSMYDRLFSLKSAPQGEIMRLIELYVRKPKPMEENDLLGLEIFNPLKLNYGWAGPEFIKHLYKVGDARILKLITKWEQKFIKDYGADSAYRFYKSAIATCFAGGELAVEADIINLDLERIYNAVILNMIQARDKTIKPSDVDYRALVSDFYYKNIGCFLVFDENNNPRKDTFRGNNLLGRIELESSKVYIHRGEMRKFLNERQISTREFEMMLEKEGLLLESNCQRRLSTGAGTGFGATPPIRVYVFKSEFDASEFAAE